MQELARFSRTRAFLQARTATGRDSRPLFSGVGCSRAGFLRGLRSRRPQVRILSGAPDSSRRTTPPQTSTKQGEHVIQDAALRRRVGRATHHPDFADSVRDGLFTSYIATNVTVPIQQSRGWRLAQRTLASAAQLSPPVISLGCPTRFTSLRPAQPRPTRTMRILCDCLSRQRPARGVAQPRQRRAPRLPGDDQRGPARAPTASWRAAAPRVVSRVPPTNCTWTWPTAVASPWRSPGSRDSSPQAPTPLGIVK